MRITIHTPDGPRPGAEPPGGIADESGLARSLLVTLARERLAGHGSIHLAIDVRAADPGELVRIARALTVPGASGSASQGRPAAEVIPLPAAFAVRARRGGEGARVKP